MDRVLDAWPFYVAYLVSFLTIGAAGLGHTGITDRLTRADSLLLRVNLLLLLVVVLPPFPTRLVAEARDDVNGERVFVTMYGLTLLSIRVLLFALDSYARNEQLYSHGEVVDEEPENLAETLAGAQARIVICTLQTFSYVDNALAVGRRNYAVAVDEAHSSQTGEVAKDIKGVLGARSEKERLPLAEKAEAGEPVTGEDRLAEAVAARGAQPNLSFFAFTATPKARTVELFRTLAPART